LWGKHHISGGKRKNANKKKGVGKSKKKTLNSCRAEGGVLTGGKREAVRPLHWRKKHAEMGKPFHPAKGREVLYIKEGKGGEAYWGTRRKSNKIRKGGKASKIVSKG